jgi:glycosyltransferase involved in cell wall biosynthesis
MQPRVSVVITTYNQEPYIGPAIRSALSQTFTDREIVVVDDGSTDGTGAVVASFGDQVRYIRQSNHGVAGSRNTGVREARGELIAFLDGDDLWDREKLDIQVAAMDQESGSGLSAVDGVQFSDEGILRSSLIREEIWEHLPPPAHIMTRPCYGELLRGNVIATASQVMVPRRVLEEVGPSDTRLRLSSDWDLYLRIATGYKLTFVNRPLIQWRYLDTSASGSADLRHLRWAEDDLEILKKQLRLGESEFAPLVREQVDRKISQVTREVYYVGRRHRKSWALRYLADLFKRNPTRVRILVHLVALALPEAVVGGMGRVVRSVLR